MNTINCLIKNFYKTINETENITLTKETNCLSSYEFHILKAVSTGNLNVDSLKNNTDITKHSQDFKFNKLIEKNYLKRVKKNPNSFSLFLTEKGINSLVEHKNFHTNISKQLSKNLKEKELIDFTKILKKINNNLLGELKNFQPKHLEFFSSNEKVKIIEVNGSRHLRDFFYSKGILLGTELKILNKNEKRIQIELQNKIFDLELGDVYNILAIPLLTHSPL